MTVFLFALATGFMLGVLAGLLLSSVFDRWSKTAAEWIMRRLFGGNL